MKSESLRGAWLALDEDERKPVVKVWLRRVVLNALRRPPDRLRADVSLTASGLDSLGAAELAERLESEAGVVLPLSELLDDPTLDELARRVLATVEQEPKTAAVGEIVSRGLEEAPLSPGQRALWVLHGLVPGGGAYHVAAAARVPDLDPAALHGAVDALVARHPALRTTIRGTPEGPVQRIAAEGTAGGSVEEVSHLSDGELQERLADEAGRPFDLEQGPLLRVTVWRREGEAPVVSLVVHHVVSDFRSMGILARDLAAEYAARRVGASPSLPSLPVTYLDWSEHRHELLAGPRGEELWEYWRQALEGAPPELSLPLDRPRPPVQRQRGGAALRDAGDRLGETVQGLARSRGVTPFVVLLAAFQAWLSRLTGRRDLLVGTPALGRTEPRVADVVGYFVNPVALRARRLEGSFEALVEEAAQRVRGALAHQDFPFPWLAERWAPGRDAGRSPVFQVVFQLQQAEPEGLAAFALRVPGEVVELPGLSLEPVAFPERSTPFDLVLRTAFLNGRLVLSFQYDRDLFDDATIRRWLGSYESLLTAAVEAPERRIEELPVLSAAQRHQVVWEWNDGETPGDPRPPVVRLREGPCREAPDRVAAVAGDRHLTYGELARRAGELAGTLGSAGIGAETPVALEREPSLGWVIAAVGVQLAGAAYLPLDPQSPPERNADMVEDAGALRLPVAPPGPGPAGFAPGLDARRLAYVIYTSGSTGRPKGVEVSHGALGNLVDWHLTAFGVTSDDRCTQLAGLSFDASVWELWPVLVAGARLEIVPPEVRRSPLDLPAWLALRGVTVSFLPTPLAEAVLARPWPSGVCLRTVLTGGDVLRRRPPEDAPFRLINDYGPTENAVVATSGPVEPGNDSRAPSLGRPVDNVDVHLVDRSLRLVAPGAVGDLVLGGASLARGYRRRPARTAGSFVPHPFAGEPGARLYRTGDLARHRASGEIDFLGRGDRQVKIRGFRIEPGEVEAALAAQEPVEEAAVVVRRGPGGPRLVAYVVAPGLGTGGQDVGKALEAGLADRLPAWMRPSAVLALDVLPRTPAGKVDRRTLAEEGPEPARPDLAVVYRPPAPGAEERIARAWRRVLQLDRVGAEDNFFDLGGHSLLLPELQLALEDELGRRLSLGVLLQHPTVASLASALEDERDGAREAPKRDARDRAARQRAQAERLRRRRKTRG